jgi:Arc/MetJ-type ribon-helix-helix transcriptional regulator
MKKSIAVKPKRGRPATGRDPFVGIRLPAALIEDIQAWSDKHEAASRSEAIRRLVELGLNVKTPARPVGTPGRKLRAQELATKAIEKIIDPSAPPEERAQRRSRLTKGPPEFREDRVDLPKAKGK